jgi:hypothetical protein
MQVRKYLFTTLVMTFTLVLCACGSGNSTKETPNKHLHSAGVVLTNPNW